MIKQKKIRIIIILSFLWINLSYSQIKNDSVRKINFELNAIGLGVGIINNKLQSNINNEFAIVANNFNSSGIGLQIAELRTYWKNRFGCTVGFDYFQVNLNENAIIEQFPIMIDSYNTSFDPVNDDGLTPISGGFSPISLSLGIVVKFPIKKISIVPFLNYLIVLAKSKSDFSVNFKNDNNNQTFERFYTYENKVKYAFNIGFDTRYQITDPLYLGLRLNYFHYQTKSIINYKDRLLDESIIEYLPIEYRQMINGILFEFVIGFRLGKN